MTHRVIVSVVVLTSQAAFAVTEYTKHPFSVSTNDKLVAVGRFRSDGSTTQPYSGPAFRFNSAKGQPVRLAYMKTTYPTLPGHRYTTNASGTSVESSGANNGTFKALFNTGTPPTITPSMMSCEFDFSSAYVSYSSGYCNVGNCTVMIGLVDGSGNCPTPSYNISSMKKLTTSGSGTYQACIYASQAGSSPVGNVAKQTVSQARVSVTQVSGMPATCTVNSYSNNTRDDGTEALVPEERED